MFHRLFAVLFKCDDGKEGVDVATFLIIAA